LFLIDYVAFDFGVLETFAFIFDEF